MPRLNVRLSSNRVRKKILLNKQWLVSLHAITIRLKNSAKLFSENDDCSILWTRSFSGLDPSKAFLYMDDLIVICCSEKHMLKNFTDVFEKCRKYNLKLHPEKRSFFTHEVTFLGHKGTNKGILPVDKKYYVIKNYQLYSARRFVAFCNYYRRFIKNFADYSRHITKLCKKM